MEFFPVFIIARVYAHYLISFFYLVNEVAVTRIYPRLPLDLCWAVLDFTVNIAAHAKGKSQTTLVHADGVVFRCILPGDC